MGCTPQLAEAETGSCLQMHEDWQEATRRLARDRQEAARCLQSAVVEEDPAERRSLRRRAAQLIAPRRSSRRRVF